MSAEPSIDDGTRPLRPRRPPTVPLADLAAALALLDPTGTGQDADADALAAVVVTGITQDSREVEPGDLYVARPGLRTHGADHADAARSTGAVAALTDAAGAARCRAAGLPTLVAGDPGLVAGPLAHALYGHPARAMTMFGVTGTNGKTTTTFFAESALLALGRRPGLIGTILTRFGAGTASGQTSRHSARTTPESTTLAATLATMREAGCDAVVMEVSSHALSLGRVDGIRYDCVAFLNLAEDHLDLHGDMERYFATKALLFRPDHARAAVVDIDDPWGHRLAAQMRSKAQAQGKVDTAGRAEIPITTVSVGADPDAAATVRTHGILTSPDGTTSARVDGAGWSTQVTVEMPGLHNLTDAVVALTMVAALGGDPETAARDLAQCRVPGRMERFDLPGGATAFVDFAHTPQAITSALTAVGGHAGVRIIAVAGCGGDRDPGKRASMGAALARGADVVIVTDDNPRSENPAVIRAATVAGARAAGTPAEIVEIGDRAAAIAFALEQAGADDVVVVLGKGHEQGQDVGGVIHPFDDRDQIRCWVAQP